MYRKTYLNILIKWCVVVKHILHCWAGKKGTNKSKHEKKQVTVRYRIECIKNH